jgi:hypothetical protein
MSEVRFPQMRAEVIDAVRALADPEYQRRVWIRRELPQPDYYDDLTVNIHILYDDTRVLEEPADTIGDVLRSPGEAAALAPLAQQLDALFERYGTDLGDEEYLDTPEWPGVVRAAQSALAALTA